MNSKINYGVVRVEEAVKDDLTTKKITLNPLFPHKILCDSDVVRFLIDIVDTMPKQQLEHFATHYDIHRFTPKAKGGRTKK